MTAALGTAEGGGGGGWGVDRADCRLLPCLRRRIGMRGARVARADGAQRLTAPIDAGPRLGRTARSLSGPLGSLLTEGLPDDALGGSHGVVICSRSGGLAQSRRSDPAPGGYR